MFFFGVTIIPVVSILSIRTFRTIKNKESIESFHDKGKVAEFRNQRVPPQLAVFAIGGSAAIRFALARSKKRHHHHFLWSAVPATAHPNQSPAAPLFALHKIVPPLACDSDTDGGMKRFVVFVNEAERLMGGRPS